MSSGLQTQLLWNKSHIFAGKSHHVVLLAEWLPEEQQEFAKRGRKKIAARDMELRVWTEPHVTLTNTYGCRVEHSGANPLFMKLGRLCVSERKRIALEFKVDALPPGNHEMIWLQLQYKQPPGERIRELPLQKLSLEFSRHLGLLSSEPSFYVEKNVELIKMEEDRLRATVLCKLGKREKAVELLKRRADQLLLQAARSGDEDLLAEAEKLYTHRAAMAMEGEGAPGMELSRMQGGW